MRPQSAIAVFLLFRRMASLVSDDDGSAITECTFAICRRPSVCRLSVTFVRPTQGIEIFGNFSTPLSTLAICDLSVKILRRSSQGNTSVGVGLNRRGVAKYRTLNLSKAISRKRCKIGGKLLLITTRKSHTFCGRNVGQTM